MRKIEVQEHYKQDKLFLKIIEAMSKSGLDINNLTRENFSEIDEFHIMGNMGTELLAETVGFSNGMKVLDLGCGIGGASRFIADTFNCKVMGIDITAAYVETAKLISEKIESKNVTFEQADATDLPFDDGIFDVVWTQHVQMNIEDKNTLLKEISRVLKPNGKFGYFAVLNKNKQKLYFPLPWAENESISYTCSSTELDNLLNSAGFKEKSKKNLSQIALNWFNDFFSKAQTKGIPLVSPKLLMGENTPVKLKNLFRNLLEKKCELEMGVFLNPKM